MPNNEKWNHHWIQVAFLTAKLSKDPSTKVGACLVSQDNRQCSLGYNGFAQGIEETTTEWNTREIKLEMVIHAEENALINCPFDKRNTKLYLTHKPCHRCLIRLLQAGISEIYYAKDYTNMGNLEIFNKHAVKFKVLEKISIES